MLAGGRLDRSDPKTQVLGKNYPPVLHGGGNDSIHRTFLASVGIEKTMQAYFLTNLGHKITQIIFRWTLLHEWKKAI